MADGEGAVRSEVTGSMFECLVVGRAEDAWGLVDDSTLDELSAPDREVTAAEECGIVSLDETSPSEGAMLNDDGDRVGDLIMRSVMDAVCADGFIKLRPIDRFPAGMKDDIPDMLDRSSVEFSNSFKDDIVWLWYFTDDVFVSLKWKIDEWPR